MYKRLLIVIVVGIFGFALTANAAIDAAADTAANTNLSTTANAGIAVGAIAAVGGIVTAGILAAEHKNRDNNSTSQPSLMCQYYSPTYNNLTADSDVTAAFTEDSATDNDFTAHITLYNHTAQDINNWHLGFTFVRDIEDNITNATIEKNVGGYYLLKGKNKIPANGSITLKFSAQYWIRNKTDTPDGMFLLSGSELSKPISVPVTKVKMFNDEVSPTDVYNTNKDDIQKWSDTFHTQYKPIEKIIIVPTPQSITINNGYFTLNTNTVIYYQQGNQAAQDTANFLKSVLEPATGMVFTTKATAQTQPIADGILITTASVTGLPDAGNAEGYDLNVTPNSVVIRADHGAGLFYGVQSLRQLFPSQLFSHSLQSGVTWQAHCASIVDWPRFTYRGAELDVARHFFSVAEVERYLDLMAINKLNTFHWHLSDDEGWRIQINKYPELTNIGAWRGYNETLPPAIGSGYNQYGGFYTQQQFKDIIQYAADRHIKVVPEIDMPGHARAMIKSLPSLLEDPNDKSQYTTPQNFHDDALNPCLDSTYTVISNVISEIAPLLPAEDKYIHVGGDEVPDGIWLGSPMCKTFTQAHGIPLTKQALNKYFFQQLQKIVKDNGKEVAGWDDMQTTGLDTSSTVIYGWHESTDPDNSYTAMNAGYPTVMQPASHFYLDLAYSGDPRDPGYYWAGYVSSFDVYDFEPDYSKITNPNLLLGVQGDLWTENAPTQARMDYLAFPKLVAVAEDGWSTLANRNWQDFTKILGKYYLQRLDYYGVTYRLPPPGISANSNQINANIEFPGLTVRYTTDGTDPTPNSPIYTGSFNSSASDIKMSSFDAMGRSSFTSECIR